MREGDAGLLRSHHWSAILTACDRLHDWTEADFLAQIHQSVRQAGLTAVKQVAFTFQPQGLSAVVLLEESHIALHFWPEKNKVTVDIHVCDYQTENQPKAEQLAKSLAQELSATKAEWHYVCLSE
jgi:S-adenosylmethionine/arginine decarboxylase-like enzyme